MTRRSPGALIRHQENRKAARQRTRDSLDRLDEQHLKYKPPGTEARLVKFDSAALEGFDRMVILDGLLKADGTNIVARMAKISINEAAEMILRLAENGKMTIGMVDGKIQAGVTQEGWKAFREKLR